MRRKVKSEQTLISTLALWWMGPTFGRPYGNAGFAKSEAEEAKNCLSPDEERIGASFFRAAVDFRQNRRISIQP